MALIQQKTKIRKNNMRQEPGQDKKPKRVYKTEPKKGAAKQTRRDNNLNMDTSNLVTKEYLDKKLEPFITKEYLDVKLQSLEYKLKFEIIKWIIGIQITGITVMTGIIITVLKVFLGKLL